MGQGLRASHNGAVDRGELPDADGTLGRLGDDTGSGAASGKQGRGGGQHDVNPDEGAAAVVTRPHSVTEEGVNRRRASKILAISLVGL